MRILQVHNRYVRPGGEDAVVENEAELLRSHGHEVLMYERSNNEIRDVSLGEQVRRGLETTWSARSYAEMRRVLRERRPDIVHAHNTFPLISPAVYWAAAREGIPVVQTVHNYRLVCANGLLMRSGAACMDCVEGNLVSRSLTALRHRCYRDSLLATGAVVAMQVTHTCIGTYADKVDAYVALTDFAKSVLVRGGFPSDRIHIRPNHIEDPVPLYPLNRPRKKQIVFVGRVVHEKGLDLLLDAWTRLDRSGWSLVIAGDGPDRALLQQRFPDSQNVRWLGWRSKEEVLREVAHSAYLAVPSRCYEGLPMAVVEAFALGTPVIGPRHGPFPELIGSDTRGVAFDPSNVTDLVSALRRAVDADAKIWSEMSRSARVHYVSYFTADHTYRLLIDIYDAAIERASLAPS